ncbi:MAG: hypothetical protein ACRELE_06480 [Gemmatimonadales bacterium]
MPVTARLSKLFYDRFGEQSRWLVGIWITVVAAGVALWFRQ